MIKDLINKLTDAFQKDEKSNIGKLFLIVDEQLTAARKTLTTAEKWRDIDNAKGRGLDLIGDNVAQNRGRATDEIYRVLIRGKVARNISDGTTNRIIEALAKTLNCAYDEINIFTVKEDNEDEPAGVRVAYINLNGTFSFSSIPDEIETSQFGFSSDGTDGGTLGGIFEPEDDYPLPI